MRWDSEKSGRAGNDPIADIHEQGQSTSMLQRFAILGLLCATLTSCSYGYEVLAVARAGQIHFIVDPRSQREPSCLREIEVIAQNGVKALPDSGDDISRVGYGTFWSERLIDGDFCANEFPVPYGKGLEGRPGQVIVNVKPKALIREMVYEVSTTTGSTGYGRGRFRAVSVHSGS